MKTCAKCKLTLPDAEFFWADSPKKSYRRSECKKCNRMAKRPRLKPERERCPTCGYLKKRVSGKVRTDG